MHCDCVLVLPGIELIFLSWEGAQLEHPTQILARIELTFLELAGGTLACWAHTGQWSHLMWHYGQYIKDTGSLSLLVCNCGIFILSGSLLGAGWISISGWWAIALSITHLYFPLLLLFCFITNTKLFFHLNPWVFPCVPSVFSTIH